MKEGDIKYNNAVNKYVCSLMLIVLLLATGCAGEANKGLEITDVIDTACLAIENSVVSEEGKVIPTSITVVEQYDSTWTKNTKPEPIFTNTQIEEKLNGLSTLNSGEKKKTSEEIQKDFNNPMKSQAVSGIFTDDRKSSYTINEYTRRMAMTDGLKTKVVKVTRNDKNRITELVVEEIQTEE